ncbi:hypothetical protein [Nonomuraea sp. NPDC049158]|uniref:hypothetical protein n=1 Tax=Nonomuraea sp. NPDC049158 TaxID=3155649 RepID=UPI0033ECAAA0
MQLQFTKRMMRLAVLLLVVQLAWLTWALVSPAGGLALRLIGVRAQAARWTVRQFARRLLINIALFGGLLGGMDLLVQLTQSRREGVDWRQVGSSAATGALTGGLLTGLAWAFPTRSLWMLMGQSGVANAGAVLGSELWSGDGSVDWLMVLKGLSSGVAGGADAHWASWSPDGGHPGPRPLEEHARFDDPGDHGGRNGGGPDDADGNGRTRLADAGDPRPLADGEHARPQPVEERNIFRRSVDQLINWARSSETRPVQLRDHATFSESARRGVVAREPLAGAGGETVKVEKVRLADGSHAVDKEFSGTDRRDRDHLNSRLGRAVGADVAATHIVGERRLLIDWIDGKQVPVQRGLDGKWHLARLHNTREGILLGLLDALTGNHDRFSPERVQHDFLEGTDGRVKGFDGDKAFSGRLPDTNSPFSRHFFRDKGELADWAPNPLSKADIEALRPRVEALRQEFRALGHSDWYNSVGFAFEQIAKNASGTVSVLDAPPGSVIVEPRAAGPAFGERPRTFEGTAPPRAVEPLPQDSPGELRAHPARSQELNPEYRTPLLPVHGDSVNSGVMANVIDPRQAVRASEWAHLRSRATAHLIENRVGYPDLDASARVEARRFAIRGDGGEVRRVTEFTIKIRYVAKEGMTAEQVMRLKSNALDGMDLYYNHQHRLSDGSQLHVRLTFEKANNARPGDEGVVTFRPSGHPDIVNWCANTDAHLHAHEIGHHLGLPDEYREHQTHGRRTLTDRGLKPGANLMGDASRVRTAGRVLIDHAGHEVPPRATLLDHHLAHFSDLLPRSDRSVEGDAGFRQPADEWTRPVHTPETLRLPRYLRDLLVQFPHRGGDLLDHVQVLDRAHSLFGDRVTQRHVDYTAKLFDAAHSLYGAVTDTPTVRDLRRLHSLVKFLGRGPDSGLPDAAWLKAETEAVLGGHADPRTVEGLSRLAEWSAYTGGRPHPGETGATALRRAAGEFLGEPPSEAAVRRASAVFSYAAEQSPVLAQGAVDFGRVTTELRAKQAGEWHGRSFDGADFAHLVERLYDDPKSGQPAGPPKALGESPHPGSHNKGPAWDARRVGEAVTDWGARPHGGKPHTFSSADLVAARKRAQPVNMGARDPGVAAIERRDMTVKARDGVMRPVTEYTVKFAYRSDTAPLGHLGTRVRAGLDRFVNGRFVLPDGSALLVQAEFVPAEHRSVTIGHRGEAPGSRPFDFPHEASHVELALKVLDQLGVDDALGPPPTAEAASTEAAPKPDAVAARKQAAWDARRVSEAVTDWGATPHGEKPHTFRPAELVTAGRQVQPVNMGARDPRVAAIERRYLTLKPKDGVVRRVTEYTVKFAYRSDMSRADVGYFRRRVRAALGRFVDGRYVLPDGSALLVRAEFVPLGHRGVTIGHRDEAPGSRPFDFHYEASYVELALKVLDQLGMDDVLGPP